MTVGPPSPVRPPAAPGVLGGVGSPPVLSQQPAVPVPPPPVTPTRIDRILGHVPVIGVGLINTTTSHFGSAALLAGASTLFPILAPRDPLTWTAVVEGYWANFGFAALIGIPIFVGLEGFCSKNSAGRAWWRKILHTDVIVSGVKRGWQWLTGRQAVKAADRYLTDGLTFRRPLRVKTPAEFNERGEVTRWRNEGVALEVDYWGSVKQDIGALALYGKEFVLRGIVGMTSLFTRRMPESVRWATTVKRFLKSSPLRRLAHSRVHNGVLRRQLPAPRVDALRTAEIGTRSAVVSAIVLESTTARRHVDDWLHGSRMGRAVQRIDGLAHFVGRAFPGTGGRFSGAAADLAGNIGTDVISADILAGGTTSIWASVAPSAIVSVSGALANSGLAELMQRNPTDPGWTYGQTFTRRMLLAVPRSWVFRALCASPRSPWVLKYGAQIAIGLYSLLQAEWWTRQARERFGLALPDDELPDPIPAEERLRREVEEELVRRLDAGA